MCPSQWPDRDRGLGPQTRPAGSDTVAEFNYGAVICGEGVFEMCYAAIALVTDLDAGTDSRTAVRAVDVFAEFEKNLVSFKKLVHEAIGGVPQMRNCAHCLAHEGVALPFELP